MNFTEDKLSPTSRSNVEYKMTIANDHVPSVNDQEEISTSCISFSSTSIGSRSVFFHDTSTITAPTFQSTNK